MKKEAIILLLVLFLPFLSAVQVDLNKQFKKGETLIPSPGPTPKGEKTKRIKIRQEKGQPDKAGFLCAEFPNGNQGHKAVDFI